MRIVALLLIVLVARGAPAGVGTKEGDVHPDPILPLASGEDGEHRISDYRGKKVLLFNFASW